MMKNKKLLVIGSYPSQGKIHSRRVVGCASYGKSTVLSIQKKASDNLDITVLADIFRKKTSYKDQQVHIKRVWKSNSFLSFPKLFIEIFKNYKDTKNILFEFEVMMFGKIFYLLPLPFFNFTLKLLGKKITFVCHQVIKDIRDFEGHVNINKESPKNHILNFIISVFYRLIILSVNKVIVFDEELKNNLAAFGDESKIKVIPLAFRPLDKNVSRPVARKNLMLKDEEFTILCFGFLAWYKGTDWIIEAYKKFPKSINGKKIKLILAGGPARNHRDKEFYKNYVSWIKEETKKHNIMLAGFVPEEEIANYYQASDIVIFPYRLQMSASGPLSMAYSFKKPVLVSNRLSKIFNTGDLKEIIKKENLSIDELTFKLNYGDFVKKISMLQKNPSYLKSLTNISAGVSKERSWEKIGALHFDEIFEEMPQRRFSLGYVFLRS
ncbi:MAG: glycosyltransferase family 4 protein [Candidatus Levybacteria bacterium]|nr:glycosyltransferase family 4 protein [Candidatus Levybacteria bacterium]